MHYQIEKIERGETPQEHVYMLVHFWRQEVDRRQGRPPLVSNDFFVRLNPNAKRNVRDAQGRVFRLRDSTWVTDEQLSDEGPEDEVLVEAVPMAVLLLKAIHNFIPEIDGKLIRGDYTMRRGKRGPLSINGVTQRQRRYRREPSRDLPDREGILARSDVQALRNSVHDYNS